MNRPYGALLILALTPASARGVVVVNVPFPNLATEAAVIVVGSLDAESGPSISVVRTLKGPATNATINVRWPAGVRLPPSGQRLYGLWLLREDSGALEPVPHRSRPLAAEDVFLPLADGPIRPEFAYSEDDPLLDRLVKEIQSALASERDVADISPLFIALDSVAHPAPGVYAGHREQMAPAIILAHQDKCAVAGLVRSFDATVVENVHKRLSLGADIPVGLLVALGSVTHPDVVPGLSTISALLDGSHSLTREVVDALRRIHTKATLPLLRRYLDSDDPQIQLLAVTGLALYANNYPPGNVGFGVPPPGPLTTAETRLHHPATPVFRSDPSRYVAFWRNWCVAQSCDRTRLRHYR